jgi:hypothetical protein
MRQYRCYLLDTHGSVVKREVFDSDEDEHPNRSIAAYPTHRVGLQLRGESVYVGWRSAQVTTWITRSL